MSHRPPTGPTFGDPTPRAGSAAPDAAVPEPDVSASVPDWSREAPRRFWDPSRRLLRSIRRYQAARARATPLARVAARWWVLSHRFWSVVTQAEIPLNARIGGGLLIPHPNGIVINDGAEIGPNCLIFQQVTIGVRDSAGGHDGAARAPRIGGHVDIGAGARVLGAITIGDHARIGANAVVLIDVPAGAGAAGIPARLLPPRPAGPAP